ncbi:MAG: FHA domain-containing protein [Kofleriaceae bacterium]|nr:FHA domain-containing protein [Myxococcales bacterium]MCB9564008.1 FHA domain-containing protein [Kofleriaceae bacterium]
MSANRTRIVELRRGIERGEADNRRTGVMVVERMPTLPFQRLFAVGWEEMRRLVCTFTSPGVVVVAVDAVNKRVAGSLCLQAKVGAANAAVVGRHGHCDLYLDGDPAMSLRHLALVVAPLAAGATRPQVAFRLLDLRTRTAFLDEGGRRLESVTAEGATFVAVGSHALFFLVTGDDTVWPESASEAWKCIPERVYLDEVGAEPDRWARRRKSPFPEEPTDGAGRMAEGTGVIEIPDPGPVDNGRITLVRTRPGPARAQVSLVGDGDTELGALQVTAKGKSQRISVGERAAAGGILLGRYDRCDTHGATVVAHHGVSRVHLLVLSVGDAVYAIDTGSTNGTFRRGHDDEVRIVRLEAGQDLVLGDDLARVSWTPRQPA